MDDAVTELPDSPRPLHRTLGAGDDSDGRRGDRDERGRLSRLTRLTRRGSVSRADGENGGTFDLRNSWQVAVGAILIPLGVVFIMLGWYGAAHARVLQQQFPYLISGGLIGLGCMVLGGLFYFSHWIYRLYDQADLHHEEQLKVLEELIRSLSVPAHAESNGSVGYVATASGTVYHQADCPVIAHHPTELRMLSASAMAALRPCQICLPGG
jgi:hypothetical protein